MQAQPGGDRVLPGTFPVRDLPDIGVEIHDAPETAYATIAGLVLAVLGRIPEEPGDRIELADWTIDGRAITEVHLRLRSSRG